MTSELEDDELLEDDDLPEDDNWSDWRNDVTSTVSSVIDRACSIEENGSGEPSKVINKIVDDLCNLEALDFYYDEDNSDDCWEENQQAQDLQSEACLALLIGPRLVEILKINPTLEPLFSLSSLLQVEQQTRIFKQTLQLYPITNCYTTEHNQYVPHCDLHLELLPLTPKQLVHDLANEILDFIDFTRELGPMEELAPYLLAEQIEKLIGILQEMDAGIISDNSNYVESLLPYLNAEQASIVQDLLNRIA
jgi:hypothetical protein